MDWQALLVASLAMPFRGDLQYAITIPAFLLDGAAASMLWSAQGVHLSRAAVRHGLLTGQPVEAVLSTFYGIVR